MAITKAEYLKRVTDLEKLSTRFAGLAAENGWVAEFCRETGFCRRNILLRESRMASIFLRRSVFEFPLEPGPKVGEKGKTVVCILPGNGPVYSIGKVLSGAYLSGHCVHFKYPRKLPKSGLRIAEIIAEIGLEGITLSTDESESAEDFATQKRDTARNSILVLFGSDSWFASLLPSLQGWYSKIVFEGPGNDPAVCLRGTNSDLASQEIVVGFLNNGGQSCSAIKRLYVHEDDSEQVIAKMIAVLRNIPTGDPSDGANWVGPIKSKRVLERSIDQVAEAGRNGACLLWGDPRPQSTGLIVPSLLSCQPSDRIVVEETFYPVLPIVTYKSYEELMNFIRLSPFGLNACIFGNLDMAVLTTLVGCHKDVSVGRFGVREERVRDLASIGGYRRSAVVIDYREDSGRTVKRNGRFELQHLFDEIDLDWF